MRKDKWEKAKYIKGYAALRREEKGLAKELEEYQTSYNTLQAVSQSNTPVSKGAVKDLSDYMAERDKQIADKAKELSDVVREYRSIEAAVKELKDPEERTVLRLKYMQGKSWEQVARAMHYSVITAQRIRDTCGCGARLCDEQL